MIFKWFRKKEGATEKADAIEYQKEVIRIIRCRRRNAKRGRARGRLERVAPWITKHFIPYEKVGKNEEV